MLSILLRKPLVIGASGLVGGALMDALTRRGHEPIGTYLGPSKPGLLELDLDNPLPVIEHVSPSIIFLAAALTNVDWCETHPDETMRTNVEGVRTVAKYCVEKRIPLVFFSSDYVFDGTQGPYAEDASRNPLNVYGKSKMLAEDIVIEVPHSVVLRITNVFDIGYDERNFMYRLVTSLGKGQQIRIPTDQRMTPMFATWIGDIIVKLMERNAVCMSDDIKILNIACDDMLSRVEFAERVVDVLGADRSLLVSVPTKDLRQQASRPLEGGLRNDKLKALLGVETLSLSDALQELLPRMKALYGK